MSKSDKEDFINPRETFQGKKMKFSPLFSLVYFASYGPMGKSRGLTCDLVIRAFQRDLIRPCTPILLQMVQFRANANTKHIDSGAHVLPPAWSTLH